MVGYRNREIVKVPLEDVAGKLKMVEPDATIVKEAKLLGSGLEIKSVCHIQRFTENFVPIPLLM